MRRALACVSHELNGSLQALFTFLKLSEREAPSRYLSLAMAAATRLRHELQGIEGAGVTGAPVRERVDLVALIEQLGEAAQLERRDVDAWVRGLRAALHLLVQQVAAGLPAGTPVPVALQAGEGELRVLVGAPLGERTAADAIGAARPSLAELVSGLVAELHGGRLWRSGPAGEHSFELVLPRELEP